MSLALAILAAIVGFICLAGIGANDVANSQAMAVGSGAISLRVAQIMASIFEFAGAALVGHHVSSTVGEKIVDLPQKPDVDNNIGFFSSTLDSNTYESDCEHYAWGMFAAISSCAIWMFLCTFFKMPVSSTHSIIGALMGVQLVLHDGDFSSENWEALWPIACSWIITPFLGFICAVTFMSLLDKWWPLYLVDNESLSSPLLISTEMDQITNDDTDINVDDNLTNTSVITYKNRKPTPKKTFAMGDHFDIPIKPAPLKFSIIWGLLLSTLILFILAAGPKSIEILSIVPWWSFILIGIGSFFITAGVGYFVEPFFRKWYINKYYVNNDNSDTDNIDYNVFNNSDYFTLYLVIASASVSFAHGGNDVANVLGPFGQIFQYETEGDITSGASIPIYLAAGGGLAIGIGFILFGKGVLETVGTKIAEVNYQSGFIAQYSAALTVLICDILALPVSSSTVIIGAVTGVGFYNTTKEKSIRKKIGKERKMTLQEQYDALGYCGKLMFRIKRMNLKILLKIVGTWIITIPCNATLCAAIYAIIDAVWGS